MSYDSTRIALYSELLDKIDQNIISLRFDTIKEEDPITLTHKPWIRCFLEPIETSQHNLGTSTPLDKTIGFLMIEIYDREENGYAEILRIADFIKSLFYRKSFQNGDIIINKATILNKKTYLEWNCKVLQLTNIET